MMRDPVAMALVRRPSGELLALYGQQGFDLPYATLLPGEQPITTAERRLREYGVVLHAGRIRWSAVAYWNGAQRPLTLVVADRWDAAWEDARITWVREWVLARGWRAALYKLLFERVAQGAVVR